MGEYARLKSTNQRIKIGTCEDMYYLRFDQRNLVKHESGNVDPNSPADAGQIRFRFPFPQEDGMEPGDFEPFYGLEVPGAKAAKDCGHYSVQFSANRKQFGSYLVSLPCPNSKDADKIPAKVSRNGIGSEVEIVQQRLIGDELWTVCQCTACGAKWRCDKEAAEELIVALRAQADREPGQADYFNAVADRVEAGYKMEALASA